MGGNTFKVYAWNHAGDVARWQFANAYKRSIGGNVVLVSSQTSRLNSAGAAALWTATVVGVTPEVYVNVTGGAGQTIDWAISIDSEDFVCGNPQ